jgi:hypothetical protein
MYRLVVAMFVVVVLAQEQASGGQSLPPWPRLTAGEDAGFLVSPQEHIVNDVGVVTVRRIRGVVVSEVGEWPDDTVVVFEARGPHPSTKVRGVVVDAHGQFDLGPLPAGRYRFKATAPGWQSSVGEVIVNPRAARNAHVKLALPLGV